MIDEIQRAMRGTKIGGSDAAAACGRDPYRTPYDLWAEKTGRLPPFQGNQATEAGMFLEPALLAFAAHRLGATISSDLCYFHPNGLRAVNMDGLILNATDKTEGRPAIVEAKSSSVYGKAAIADQYGEDGTDSVPTNVLIQTHFQFGVLDEQPDLPRFDLAFVPVFIGFRGFILYRIDRNDELVDAVGEKVDRFMTDHVLTNVPPPDSMPSMEVLRKLKREPGKVLELDDPEAIADFSSRLNQWNAAKTAAKDANDARETTQAAVLEMLKDAEAIRSPLGELTYLEVNRTGYTVEPTTYRTPKWKSIESFKSKKKVKA